MSRRAPRTAPLIVALITSVAAVTLAVCVTAFLRGYRTVAVQNARTSSAQAVSQVVGTVSNYVQNLDDTISDVMGEMYAAPGDRDEYLEAWLNARSEVVAVTTYTEAGALQNCWALDHAPRQQVLQNLSFDLAAAQNSPDGYISAPHVESIFAGYYPWVVTVVRPMPAGASFRWVAVDVRFSNIGASISGVGIGQHGYCFLMDDQGNMVYHPQQQLLYAGIKQEDTARLATLAEGTYVEDTIICSIQDVPDSAWRVVGVSFIDETVNESLGQMARIALATAALILAAALLVGWVVSHMLSRPLQRLENAMEAFEQDADGFAFQPVAGTREVQELSDSFGHMVGRIQALMTTVREEEVNLRKTELKALQAQINPHFLYNTLDSIAWMCERGKNADAVKMVHALAKLFRISISRGHELIPIEKELQHAEAYLLIQKFRYKNQFTYHFTVDEGCLHCLCNKITLQPIIENAITHGLDLLVEPGHIEIEVCADGSDILFKVSDDGIGMAPEQVAQLLHSEPGDRTGIGIKNVNDRLRIYFGPQYGLSIESVPDEGTTVTIRMPRVPEDREGDYDKTR